MPGRAISAGRGSLRAWEAMLFGGPSCSPATNATNTTTTRWGASSRANRAEQQQQRQQQQQQQQRQRQQRQRWTAAAGTALLLRSLLAPYLRYAHASVPLRRRPCSTSSTRPFPSASVCCSAFLERVYGPSAPALTPAATAATAAPAVVVVLVAVFKQGSWAAYPWTDRPSGARIARLDSGRLVDRGRSSDYGESGDSDEEEEEEEEEEEDDNSGHDDDEETDEDDDDSAHRPHLLRRRCGHWIGGRCDACRRGGGSDSACAESHRRVAPRLVKQ